MEIGEWIEFGEMIIEITCITDVLIIGKEVIYDDFEPLRYGEPVVINKEFL